MLGLALLLASACAAPAVAAEPALAASAERDGSHDFDFAFGVWRTHTRRFKGVFSPAPTSIELVGTVTVRPVWGGKAALEEIEADGPDGHWQGLTLFLYNPQARQWSQSFANSSQGALQPPTIGAFRDGRGELIAQDRLSGRSILVRSVWRDIRPDFHRYEESYSDDGGRTWRTAFKAELTRLEGPDGSARSARTAAAGPQSR